ncbi:toll-like receptor 2 [Pecten maximus]|uniref:toll-like receptor 2 n=1 Tax=Pecten maximus TaxID=6579 RepID=UPI001458DE94|nr:toll-like receptor 2 [Pecten maximus]XP_033762547.1 toll-like receptor 2 [Pecten maximus]
MKGYWLLIFYIPLSRLTVGHPGCCKLTQSNGEIHTVCSDCNLKVVPNGLPVNTTSLDLSMNNIGTIYNNSFTSLRNLKSLSLNSNKLRTIHSKAFYGLTQLHTLSLYNNMLHGNIDSDVFCPLSNLINLDLKGNLFHLDNVYPGNALACLGKVQSLGIDVFDGFHFGDEFLHLKSLKFIDFLGRGKISIKNSSFLGLTQSPITRLIIGFEVRELQIDALSPFRTLRRLTINSGNNIGIREVLSGLYGLRNTTMEYIDIGKNADEYSPKVILNKTNFVYLKTICVKELHLYKNGIAGVTFDAILSWTSRLCLNVLDISNNRLVTGQIFTLLPLFPELTHVHASNEKTMTRRARRYVHREMTVFLPGSLQYINVSHNALLGDMANLTFAEGNTLSIIDVSYPKGYSCSRGLLKGLVHVSELYMSGIDCSRPNPLMFSSMKGLTKLQARHSNFGQSLVTDSLPLFSGLYNLSYIDLTANHLKHIEVATFIHQTHSLKTLVFANNDLERVPSKILENMFVLEAVDLRHNSISTITETEFNIVEEVKKRSKTFTMRLSGNPLLCSCDNMEFLKWILITKVVSDKDNLTCFTTDGDLIEMKAFLDTIDSFVQQCEEGYWILVSVVLVALFLLACAVGYRQRTNCYWILTRSKTDKRQCEFDLFVGYSHHDSVWFKHNMVPVLENADIKFCCYDLNFEAGKSIADNIVDSIASSCRVLFLVSYHFIHSEWGTYEMGIASKDAFRGEENEKAIIVFLDDIKRSEMPKVLRQIWDQIVCLKWPRDADTIESDRQSARQRFWKKLTKSLRKGQKCSEVRNKETSV